MPDPQPVRVLMPGGQVRNGIAWLYRWRRHLDGSWWAYCSWTRQLTAEEAGSPYVSRVDMRREWVPSDRIQREPGRDYRRVPVDVWEPGGWHVR